MTAITVQKEKEMERKEEPAYYLDVDKKRAVSSIFENPLLYLKVN